MTARQLNFSRLLDTWYQVGVTIRRKQTKLHTMLINYFLTSVNFSPRVQLHLETMQYLPSDPPSVFYLIGSEVSLFFVCQGQISSTASASLITLASLVFILGRDSPIFSHFLAGTLLFN